MGKRLGAIILVAVIGVACALGYRMWKSVAAERALESAVEQIGSGNYDEAIGQLEQWEPYFSGTARADELRFLLARCHTKAGQVEEARSQWELMASAGSQSKHRREALVRLACFSQEQGEDEKAFALHQEAKQGARPGDLWLDSASYGIAQLLLKRGELLKARSELVSCIERNPGSELAQDMQELLGTVNVQLLFSPVVVPGESEFYTVSPGDSLAAIAQKYGTTVELVRRANALEKDIIRPGQRLKVPTIAFSAVVDKSQNTLILKANGTFFKLYRVGTGKNNITPTGVFTLSSKLQDPVWFHEGKAIPAGDPGNELGSRWMGFQEPYKNYGIHGTRRPETIGKQSSAGCIRLVNAQVEELFVMLPLGTEIKVMD